jgi:hypothetical protein
MSQSSSQDYGTAQAIISLERRCRAAGICLFYDTNGAVCGVPLSVCRKHPLLMQEVVTYREGIKKWLRILVSQTSRET